MCRQLFKRFSHCRFEPRWFGSRLMTLLVAGLLVGCSSGTRAPVVDLSVPQPSSPSTVPVHSEPVGDQTGEQSADHSTGQADAERATTYVVKAGDTLYSIARTTGASLDTLIRTNDIGDPDVLRIGQVLTLASDGAAPARADVGSSVQTPPAETTPAPPPTPPVATRPASVSPPARTAPVAPPRAADAKLNNWAWPAGGTVMQAFSPTTKGIDIAGRLGDPVQAAADGKIAYVGNGVRGLGNLILIEHAGGFLSAYAHNQRMFVTKDQAIKRGAKIAEIGQTETTSPRLHFEIRREGTPVNPLHYLPPR